MVNSLFIDLKMENISLLNLFNYKELLFKKINSKSNDLFIFTN
jgi:hypothetical protein